MKILFHGGGASLTELNSPSLVEEEWNKLRSAAGRLLSARGDVKASEILERYPFQLLDGTNHFGDEFSVLHATVSLDQYVELGEIHAVPEIRESFRHIGSTISEIGPYTRFIAVGLDVDEKVVPVAPPSPKITSEAVERALEDAEQLIKTRGPSSAIDRVHTAFHGYLRVVLERKKIKFVEGDSITTLFRLLRENDPALQHLGHRSEDALKMIRAMSTVIDSLNTLRNRASGAHPNEEVLAEPEAMLAINAARTLLHYLDEKLEN
ncbi:abortive infection family protein [Geomonas subterranea]|uniref:Abortive infection family protein n=1 Tax=Geomonas subterranea TaxID=2847989 RepID=A0ABX8LE72_9BACT|nr:abortive infection family protein [Geomonas subterranea]QXE89176.1 abortive infection family protein [Geomonas subterranea]QXM08708.1 abortive infection family protein [Geomonas subterranea]